MDSLFEPSYFDSLDSNFLSFSSLADISSPAYSAWDAPSSSKSRYPSSAPSSDTSSPSPIDPFQIVASAFDVATPAGDIGIFHTATSGAKLSLRGDDHAYLAHRASSSTDGWSTPLTPTLTTKSCDTHPSFATPSELQLPPSSSSFSWDDAPTTLASSAYAPTTQISACVPPTPTPSRVASNPALTRSPNPNRVKPVTSMPTLKEEEHGVMPWMFDATIPLTLPSEMPSADPSETTLVDDFDWVFGDYGLGEYSANAAVPTDSTIFAAFQEPAPASVDPLDLFNFTSEQTNLFDTPSTSDPLAWLPMQDVDSFPFDPSNFTIDPVAVMPQSSLVESRPTSGPSTSESYGTLSAPADAMQRSMTSPAYTQPRSAPPRDLFSYAPQHIPAAPAVPSYVSTSRIVSNPNPNPTFRRTASNNLSIQIHPPNYSTFIPSHSIPLTPQSASMPLSLAPAPMTRAGTQPLPMKRTLSGSQRGHDSSPIPEHLSRAHAMVQMQEAKEQAERQEIRRRKEARRVGMAEASVMQPVCRTAIPHHRSQPTIVGWNGPTAPPPPVLTSAPLMTMHPPPMTYPGPNGPSYPPQHRVHPPPHQYAPRPIARLPSSPSRMQRKASAPAFLPPKRSPAKRKPSAAGGFSWGEATFINFTSDDAEKLLTGVAPSGSQSKRRREEEAARGSVDGLVGLECEDGSRKRSRSDE